MNTGTEVMSYDLGVWYPQKQIGNEEATELYVRLCDGDTRGIVANPAVDAFYAELTTIDLCINNAMI
jgi:hypothetical protein